MKHVHAPYIPMTTVLTPVLANHNAHPRDEHIVFHEEGHSYDILCDPDNTYISVTTFIHMHFDKFDSDSAVQAVVNGRGWKEGHKYWGMSGDEMKAMWEEMRDSAAQAGTALHYAIECFHNRPALPYPYTYAQLLADMGTIPMVHIAKCLGVSVPSLKRAEVKLRSGGSNPPGGKFHPDALGALRALERQYTLNTDVSAPLVRIAKQSCSFGVISNYTGHSEAKLRKLLGA